MVFKHSMLIAAHVFIVVYLGICCFPKGPNTSLEGVLEWFLGVKPLGGTWTLSVCILLGVFLRGSIESICPLDRLFSPPYFRGRSSKAMLATHRSRMFPRAELMGLPLVILKRSEGLR